jgi:GNAT superfamily N-acetyltransferase
VVRILADERPKITEVLLVPASSGSIVVRSLTARDLPAFLGLIEALAHYESLAPPDAEARERLARDALAKPPRFRTLLAELDGAVVGYAITFDTYSTFLALPTLYLEDLFVLPEARGRGVGGALFRACAAEAHQRGCGRMEWEVLAWNDLAIGFYEHLRATPLHDSWRCYRLDRTQLAELSMRP